MAQGSEWAAQTAENYHPEDAMTRRPIVPPGGSQREERPILRLLWTILWGICLIALVALLIAGMPGGKL